MEPVLYCLDALLEKVTTCRVSVENSSLPRILIPPHFYIVQQVRQILTRQILLETLGHERPTAGAELQ